MNVWLCVAGRSFFATDYADYTDCFSEKNFNKKRDDHFDHPVSVFLICVTREICGNF